MGVNRTSDGHFDAELGEEGRVHEHTVTEARDAQHPAQERPATLQAQIPRKRNMHTCQGQA